jgi:hypothetical protein
LVMTEPRSVLAAADELSNVFRDRCGVNFWNDELGPTHDDLAGAFEWVAGQVMLGRPRERRRVLVEVPDNSFWGRLDRWLDVRVIDVIRSGSIPKEPWPPNVTPGERIPRGRDALSILRRSFDPRPAGSRWLEAINPTTPELRKGRGYAEPITYRLHRALQLRDWASIEDILAVGAPRQISKPQRAYLIAQCAYWATDVAQVTRMWNLAGGSRDLLRIRPQAFVDSSTAASGTKAGGKRSRRIDPVESALTRRQLGTTLKKQWPTTALRAAGLPIADA